MTKKDKKINPNKKPKGKKSKRYLNPEDNIPNSAMSSGFFEAVGPQTVSQDEINDLESALGGIHSVDHAEDYRPVESEFNRYKELIRRYDEDQQKLKRSEKSYTIQERPVGYGITKDLVVELYKGFHDGLLTILHLSESIKLAELKSTMKKPEIFPTMPARITYMNALFEFSNAIIRERITHLRQTNQYDSIDTAIKKSKDPQPFRFTQQQVGNWRNGISEPLSSAVDQLNRGIHIVLNARREYNEEVEKLRSGLTKKYNLDAKNEKERDYEGYETEFKEKEGPLRKKRDAKNPALRSTNHTFNKMIGIVYKNSRGVRDAAFSLRDKGVTQLFPQGTEWYNLIPPPPNQ